MGHMLVKMLRECEAVIWGVVILECNSVKQLEESIAKNFIELEQTRLSTNLFTILLAILHIGTWDSGGCSLVYKKVHLTWSQRKTLMSLNNIVATFNLEDNVDF